MWGEKKRGTFSGVQSFPDLNSHPQVYSTYRTVRIVSFICHGCKRHNNHDPWAVLLWARRPVGGANPSRGKFTKGFVAAKAKAPYFLNSTQTNPTVNKWLEFFGVCLRLAARFEARHLVGFLLFFQRQRDRFSNMAGHLSVLAPLFDGWLGLSRSATVFALVY